MWHSSVGSVQSPNTHQLSSLVKLPFNLCQKLLYHLNAWERTLWARWRRALCLLQFFSRVGFPQEILTDRGSNFMSRLLKGAYQLLGIRGLRTTLLWQRTEINPSERLKLEQVRSILNIYLWHSGIPRCSRGKGDVLRGSRGPVWSAGGGRGILLVRCLLQ